ncbi:molybdopterin-binding oxidoreductase [Luteimonas gilva]|uniref:Molybdopterin-binding oxidoreductase n=1 Tax=Luteimonas gilva TaxID=2572684 RepID=A0A4U5JQM1_9GAMM|nr:molybdopterin-binding oxidoreductase [Luteimonas gilva]TKR30758.1 molybdopterin-binding oxidoreductase [Luteimonas gilva]
MTTAEKTLRLTLGFALAAGLSACAGARPVREAAPEPAGHGGHASEPFAPSPFAVPLDAATLAKLPRETVQAAAHGESLDCEGVALDALLRATGALPADKLPGPQLARYVLVGARDGYRVLYSLAELDPGTGKRRALLVDRCNGAALGEEDGPLRLIAPEDARPARWVRQVKSITVVTAP